MSKSYNATENVSPPGNESSAWGIDTWSSCSSFSKTQTVHVLLKSIVTIYSVSRKKDQNVFFVISSTKLGQFWWNLVHSFLNKCAAKLCKRLLSHLNNLSTLPCETWIAHCACATVKLLQKETPEFIPPPNSLYLNPVDNSEWEIWQQKVYKTCITDLKLSTTPMTNGCRNDDNGSVLSGCFSSSRSVMRILHTLSYNNFVRIARVL